MPPRRVPGPRTILHEVVAQGMDLAPDTRARYTRDLDEWIAFAGVDPRGWTRHTFAAFYQSLLERMKPQSANRLIASIQYASQWWSNRENNVMLNFAVVQKAKARGKTPKHALDEDGARRLLDTCANRALPANLRDLGLIVLGLETGMRRMSLIGARVQDVVPTARTLPVPVKGSGETRIAVPLSNAAHAALRPWVQWLADSGVRSGPLFRSLARVINPRNGHFTYRIGTHELTAPSIQKMLRLRGEEIGLHVHPHIFRHTFVTWRVLAGYSPVQISAMTGHRISGLGAMPHYMDMSAIAEEIRNSTPAWLKTYLGVS